MRSVSASGTGVELNSTDQSGVGTLEGLREVLSQLGSSFGLWYVTKASRA